MTTPSSSMPASGPQRTPTFGDRLSLWLLKAAKRHRRPLTAPAGGQNYDEFYEEFFEQKDLEVFDKDRRSTLRQETIVNFLAKHAPPHASVLDVGCGLGEVLGALPPQYQLSGMDYAKSNVEISTRRLKDRAVIKQGSIYEIPFPDASFDVALCLEVLEHIEDDARAVRDMARVLKPGGFLIAAVPYTYYWPEYLKLMGHFRHYTRESFSSLMNENGLRTEAYLPNYPHFHQTYTKRYTLIRAQSMTVGRLFRAKSLYQFKWPWSSKPALERLAEKLEPLRQRDAGLDYSKQETSTFLMARKPG
jgi:ubiquinone/menaquinone biosynthesis C-methylase UbiE